MSIVNYAPGGTISLIYPLVNQPYFRKSSIFYPLSSGGAIFLDSPFPNMHPLLFEIMRAAANCLNQDFQDF
jgi:hypothetical protein